MCQGSKYAWSSNMFDRILKMSQVLKKQGFWIWHDCLCKGYIDFRIFLIMAPYNSIMPKYVSIYLNTADCPWLGQKMPEWTVLTRSAPESFQDRGIFVELGQFVEFSLNGKFKLKMDTIISFFFPNIRGLFFSFWKKAGKASL